MCAEQPLLFTEPSSQLHVLVFIEMLEDLPFLPENILVPLLNFSNRFLAARLEAGSHFLLEH